MARIHYTTPTGSTGEVELTAEQMTVGRADDNAIVIQDDSVSSHHGELIFDGADWTFRDLGSTNGTKIQGQLVSELSLSQSPSFTLGSVDCVFVGDDAGDEVQIRLPGAAAFVHALTVRGRQALLRRLPPGQVVEVRVISANRVAEAAPSPASSVTVL